MSLIAWIKSLFTSNLTASPMPEARFSDEDYFTAALRAVHPRLSFLSDVGAQLGCPSQAVLNAERKSIEQLRLWADQLADRRYASAVYRWLEHAERGASEYEAEMRTGAGRKEFQEYRARSRADNERARVVCQQLPRP